MSFYLEPACDVASREVEIPAGDLNYKANSKSSMSSCDHALLDVKS